MTQGSEDKPGFWARCKVAILKPDPTSLIGMSMRDTTKDEWTSLLSSNFDSANRLSDFIGMFIRIGFLYLVWLYFESEAKKAEYLVLGWSLGICAVFAYGLYLWFNFYVIRVVATYLASDSQHWKSRPFKIAFLVF